MKKYCKTDVSFTQFDKVWLEGLKDYLMKQVHTAANQPVHTAANQPLSQKFAMLIFR